MPDTDPDDHRLLAFLLGELPEDEADVVRRTVTAQEGTAKRVAALSRMLGGLEDARELGESFKVAQEHLAPLYDLAPVKSGSLLAAAGQAVEEIVALLVSDTRRLPLPAVGFRGSATGRRVELDADGREITLSVTPKQEGVPGRVKGEVEILGRIEGVDVGAVVELIGVNGEGRYAASVDAHGFFDVIITCGAYTLKIITGKSVIFSPMLILE